MNLIRNVAIIVSALACNLQAQTVISNTNLEFQRPGQFGGTFGFTVWQNMGKTDPTGIDFNYVGGKISLGNTNLDEGSDWYLVHAGDVFSRATIAAGQFTPIVTFNQFSIPPVTVGFDFYLGVSTGQGLNWPQDRTVYGWVHVAQGRGPVVMIDNAMSYASPGIIVGTTTLVPEPATISTAICALIWSFALRNRRRN